jgi:type VI secretion system protein ImpE
MTLSAEISGLLGNDALNDAIELAKSHVRTLPTDQEARNLYIDLLILSGDYERADSQCTVAATFSPESTMGFAMLRNQLRAMAARNAWFETGALPEFPQGPTGIDKAALRLGIAHRQHEKQEAASALAELDELRGERRLLWNGRPVTDLRDLDDRIPHAMEVLMTGGGYLWIDFGKIAEVVVEPVARPRDLAFRRAELRLTDGATAPVLLPAIYHGTPATAALLLGRETQWREESTGITTGQGQRCYLAGDELAPFHEMHSLSSEMAKESLPHG